MKKARKSVGRIAPKVLNLFIAFLMLLQPVGTPGVLMAIAQEADTTVVDSAPAPDPAPKAEEPKVETPATEAVPVIEPTPVVDTTTPEVTETPANTTADVTADQTPVEETQGIITPEAAMTEKPAPAVDSTSSPQVEPETDGKDCLADGAEIKTSNTDDWNVDGDSAKTKDNVKLGVKYEFPNNKDVSITFTCLPKDPSKLSPLKIEQIAADKIALPEGVSAAAEFAYDITTEGMENGDFKYDLTLPKADIEGAEIKYIEKTAGEVVKEEVTNAELKAVDENNVKEEDKTIKVSELDHFTVFISVTFGSATTTLILNRPSSVVAGNLLIAGITFNGGSSTTVTPPTGWTSIRKTTNGTNVGIETFRKIASSSEPSNYSWGISSSSTPRAAGGVLQYSGINAASPIDASNGATGNDSTADAPSVTTTAANEIVVAFFGVDGKYSFNTPSGTTERYDVTHSDNSGPGSAADDFTQSTVGATVTKTASMSNNQDWVAQQVALKAPDTTSPTVTINQKSTAPAQADPTTTSPINFTVTFNEAVTDFATGDVTLTGTAGATTAEVTGSGTAYNVAVSGMTANGTIVASLAAGVAHDAANNANLASTSTDNTVTYTTPYVPVEGNVIVNPSFENGSGNNADNWVTDTTGTISANFSIVAGHSGSRAANINVTSASADSDAKWMHQAVTVSEGQYYNFAFWYKSSAAAEIDFLYNGSTWNWVANLPVSGDWTKYETSLLIPAGMTSLQILPLVTGTGTFASDDFSLVQGTAPVFGSGGMVSLAFDDGYQNIYDNALPILNAANLKSTQYVYTAAILGGYSGIMTQAEVLAMQAAGHDINSHTRTHDDLTVLPTDMTSEVNGSKADLVGMGFSPVDSLAYPFGEYNDEVIAAVKAAGYKGARTVEGGYNFTNTDPYKLKAYEVDGGTTVTEAEGWINTARSQKAWLILLFHEVRNDGACPTSGEDIYCTDKTNFQSIISYLKSQNMTVPTVSQGLAVMFGASTPDTIAPVLAEVTPIAALGNDNTPDYTFSSTEAGTITYAGDCLSATTAAVAGNNTVTLNPLADGLHNNCTVKVTDAAGNQSLVLAVTPFSIDATPPVTVISSATDGNSLVLPLDGTGRTKSNAITVAFSATDLNGIAKSECQLDANVYADCTSPVTYSALADAKHTLSIRSTDTVGNIEATATFAWTSDNTQPVITVLGDNPATIEYGSVYTDAGATALDNVDGDITALIVTVNPVNTSILGPYVVTYDVTDATGNAAVQNTRTVNVVPANQTITLEFIPDKIYGDVFAVNATASSGLPVTLTLGAFDPAVIVGNTITITGIGTVTVTATQAGDLNHNAAADVIQAFNVAKKAITVTADTQGKAYGEADPVLTYTYSPTLIGTDAFTGALDRVAGEDKGVYAINQGTLALNSNYDLTYVGANLTIGIKEIKVTADAKSKIYGDADPALTYTFTPALIGIDSFTGELTRAAGEDVATYAISQGTLILPSENYLLTYTPADFTISQRELSVTANDQSKTMGDPDPELTFSLAGLLQFSDIFSLARVEGEDPGTYDINPAPMGFIGNYLLNYVKGLFTIYEFPPVISEQAASTPSEDSVTITWATDHPATSRVVYDTVSRLADLSDPNYGYAYSTVETDNAPKVINHSVALTGLASGTQYFYRTVSHGSPETVSDESSFITDSSDDGDGDNDSKGDNDNRRRSSRNSNVATVALASTDYTGGTIASGSSDEAVEGAEIGIPTAEAETGLVQGDEAAKDLPANLPSSARKFWEYFFGIILLAAIGYYIYRRRQKKSEVI